LTNKTNKKKILIAPLNWGLGHATRCIPIIKALEKEGFEPIIAGDGDSLKLLQKEFPKHKAYTLPAYNIQYTKNGRLLKYKLFINTPRLIKIVKKEQKEVAKIVEEEGLTGIISDNRFGVYSKKTPSVYLTHQINVLSGLSTFLTSKIHQKIITNFNECWVPDYEGEVNLAGKLSHPSPSKLALRYIGPISRFKNVNSTFEENDTGKKKYDILVLLSGLEPQRSILEEKLLQELKNATKKVVFVRGLVSEKESTSKRLVNSTNSTIEIKDYLLQNDLQKYMLQSDVIVCRSGYSTIMDLEKLSAKAFFIPTPGQFEQEYLATYLESQNIAPFSSQKDFSLEKLNLVNTYQGFTNKKMVKENQFPLTIFNFFYSSK